MVEHVETVHLSKQQLSVYLQCPRRYYYQYILALPWEETPAAVCLGRAVHEAVAAYYRSLLRGETLPLAAMVEQFRRSWQREVAGDGVIYGADETPESLAQLGERLLAAFWEQIRPRRIEAVELPFAVDLIDPDTREALPVKLVGVIDLIESDEEGSLILVELKTARRRMTDGEAEQRLDGKVYAYALRELGLIGPEEELLVRYDVLVKGKRPAFEQLYVTSSLSDQRRFLELCRDVERAVESGVFYRREGWACQNCPYRRTCRER